MTQTHQDDPYIKALYSPERGRIACPLLQAAVGGSQRLPHAFGPDSWLNVPDDTLVPMEERLSVWEGLAHLTINERIEIAEERNVRARVQHKLDEHYRRNAA